MFPSTVVENLAAKTSDEVDTHTQKPTVLHFTPSTKGLFTLSSAKDSFFHSGSRGTSSVSEVYENVEVRLYMNRRCEYSFVVMKLLCVAKKGTLE